MSYNLTAVSDLLKRQYPEKDLPDLSYRQQAVTPLLRKIRKNLKGKDWTFPILVARGDDTRATAEGGTLITPVSDLFTAGFLNPRTITTRQFMTFEAIKDTNGDDYSFFEVASDLPKRLATNQEFHIARQVWSPDAFGAIAICGTTNNSTTVNLDANTNMNRIVRQMKIDIRNRTTGEAVVTNVTVLNYSEANKTITISGSAVSTSSSHAVYVAGETFASGGAIQSYCMNPFPALIGDGNLHNISVSSYPEWVSYVNSNTSTLTLAKIQAMVDWCEARFEDYKNGSKGLLMFVPPAILAKFADLILGDRRLTKEEMETLEIGYPTNLVYRGGSMGNIAVIKDNLMPINEIFLINPNALRFWTTAHYEYFDLHGSIFLPGDTTNAYEVRLLTRGNTAIIPRPSCGKLQAIT